MLIFFKAKFLMWAKLQNSVILTKRNEVMFMMF